MSSPIVAVNIVRRPGPHALHAVRTRSFVQLDGTVADLRKVLQDDQVIKPSDKFYIDGRALANTSEKYIKWTDVLREILVMGGDNHRTDEFTKRQNLCACQAYVPDQTHSVLPTCTEFAIAHDARKAVAITCTDHSDVSGARTVVDIPTTPVQTVSCVYEVEQPAQHVASLVEEVIKSAIVEREVTPEPLVVAADRLYEVHEASEVPIVVSKPVVLAAEQPQVATVEIRKTIPEPVVSRVLDCPCESCEQRERERVRVAVVEQLKTVVEEKIDVAPQVKVTNVESSVEATAPSHELRLLLLKSGLGAGIDVYDVRGPNKTRLPVVGQLDVTNVQFANIDNESEEVVISSTPRASAYVGSGWDKNCLSATHPWVTDSAEAVSERPGSEVTITGRYVASKCLLSFSGDVRLQPHPDLKAAVDEALAISCLSRRSAALGDVFRRFGHFYVAAVELGGMKHATCTRTMAENETQETLEADMKGTLSKLFGDGGLGCPCSECEEATFRFESEAFETVGGVTQLLKENDVDEWKASLSNSASWSATRVMRVESVISLFDDETRAKILASAPGALGQLSALQTPTVEIPAQGPIVQVEPEPFVAPVALNKVPLHRLYYTRSGEHYYTTRAGELDKAVRVLGYNYENLAAHILPEPTAETVPLYRVRAGKKHVYTTDPAELGGTGQGIVGHVYAAQRPGTFPFFRLFNSRSADHLFTTSVDEKESLLKVGWEDEGVACYVYQ